MDDLILQGSQYGDTLGFRDASNTYGIVSANSSATCYGGPGNDMIRGSFTTNASYTEYLYGDYDDDTIQAADGDDYVYGGGGDDVLYGGPGADVIYGDLGSDTIYGGDGDDTIHGDDIANSSTGAGDFIEGGDGNEVVLDGGAGGDIAGGTAGSADTRIRGGMTVISGTCTGTHVVFKPASCP